MTPKGQILTGYKATNKNMKCRGYQFELGKWHDHDGELDMCVSGFHYCEHPSGPWSFYDAAGTRLWKVEAEEVEQEVGPGADIKHVAMRIRLVEEIKVGGYRNTGDRNTGDRNTGDRNTGYMNTGDMNTGDMNTGYRNTGYRNTGDRNTGYGSVGDKHTGSFCIKPPKQMLFDRVVKNPDTIDWGMVNDLSYQLMNDEPFDATPYLLLPHATEKRIKALHRAHVKARDGMKR